jgi:hypothetical protein
MRHSLHVHPNGLIPPVTSTLKILRVNGSRVLSRPTLVDVISLTGKGLRFRSPLLFPADPDVLLGFDFTIREESIHLEGFITGSREEADIRCYDVALNPAVTARPEWIPLLNRFLSVQSPVFAKLDKSYGGFADRTKFGNNQQRFV